MASDVMQDAPDAMLELQPPGEDHSMQQLMQHTVRPWTIYAVVWYMVWVHATDVYVRRVDLQHR